MHQDPFSPFVGQVQDRSSLLQRGANQCSTSSGVCELLSTSSRGLSEMPILTSTRTSLSVAGFPRQRLVEAVADGPLAVVRRARRRDHEDAINL